jgi:hypothetical protein
MEGLSDFMKKVYPEPNTGCWIWAGRHDEKGYGRISHAGTFQVAHRYSYYLHNGEFDIKLCVLHKCDVPACVNPDHLYLGDQRQNNIDRDQRGRQKTARGSAHKLSKITEDQSIEIRRLWKSGLCQQRQLARIYGVSQPKIMQILKNISWKHTLQ